MAAPEELIPLTVSSENQGANASMIRLASAEDSCLTPEIQQEGSPRFGDSGSPASNRDEQPQEVIQQMMISDEKTEGEKVEECLKKLEENGIKWKTFVIAIICIVMKLPDVWYSEAMKYQGYSMNESIPWDEEHETYSSCMVYTEPYVSAGMVSNESLEDLHIKQNKTMHCSELNASNKWSYWGEGTKSSVVMEFELICDNGISYLSLHLYADIGVIVGSIFWTIVMDQFGRKKPFLICSVTMAVLGIVNVALHDYTMYRWMRCGIGFFRPGFELAGFLLAVELFSARKRTMAATMIEQFWGIGMMILGELMMMVPNWRHLQMITAVAGLVTSPLIGYVNESIPWLLSCQREKDVNKIMKRAKKTNNSDDDSSNNNSNNSNNNSNTRSNNNNNNNNNSNNNNNNSNNCHSLNNNRSNNKCYCERESCLCRLCCPCQPCCGSRNKNCLISIIFSMTLLWLRLKGLTLSTLITPKSVEHIQFITSWMYYGTSQKMTEMVDTGPMNLMLGGTMELTACTLCFFIIKKWGRRFPLAGFHFLAGFLLLLSLTEFCSELSMCFVTLAKILITASFGIVHLYAVEIFPTNVRAQCMCFTIVGSALGHIAATYASMQVTLIFGSVLLLASGIFFGLLVQLPETNKKPLPQNLQEMQELEHIVFARYMLLAFM